MNISYESTIDEAAQANFRLCELSGVVTRYKWIGLLWIPIVAVVVYAMVPDCGVDRVWLALLVSAALIPIHLLTYRNRLRGHIRKTMIKTLGTDQPVPSEYEMDEQGIVFRKLGSEIRFAWSSVQEIRDTAKVIELIMSHQGIVIIPKRAFTDPQQPAEWLDYITKSVARSTPPLRSTPMFSKTDADNPRADGGSSSQHGETP